MYQGNSGKGPALSGIKNYWRTVGGYNRCSKINIGAGTGKEPEPAPTIQGSWHDPVTRERQAFLQVVLENPYEKGAGLQPYTIYKTGTGKGQIYIKLLEENKGQKLYDFKVEITFANRD